MAKYVKPTLETKFHIDFPWWLKQEHKLKVHLQSHACPECLEQYRVNENKTFDWIDSETGEVFQLDLLWYLVHTHCSQDPDFIEANMPLATAIFRAFVVNNNTPLTPNEIYERVRQKSPSLILRTIGGHKVYNGIRPVTMSA